MSSTESETRKRILETTWQLMEQQQGQGVRMSDIAQAVGISRQALYLHFKSRTELLVATTRYGDEVRGLEERMERCRAAPTGVEVMAAYIDVWGNFIPEIYGIARALLVAKAEDAAAEAAWNDRMDVLRDCCRFTIEALQRDGSLAPEWSVKEATDYLWTMLSIQNWELLTRGCGWTNSQYVSWLQNIARRTFMSG
ncbi:MAG TPA: TetR/AcrR family transcriptional regulator [Chloroflexia bacterium]|nr:TetR/AcrR family transcriptional regulator [Chloroflexia bacterium]